MSKPKKSLKQVAEFFAARFVLRENSLWRVLGLVAPQKHLVITANILLTIASILGSFVLVSLFPLFKFMLTPKPASGTPAPAAQVSPRPGAP